MTVSSLDSHHRSTTATSLGWNPAQWPTCMPRGSGRISVVWGSNSSSCCQQVFYVGPGASALSGGRENGSRGWPWSNGSCMGFGLSPTCDCIEGGTNDTKHVRAPHKQSVLLFSVSSSALIRWPPSGSLSAPSVGWRHSPVAIAVMTMVN